uniref:RNA-dependent RNA-polymerase n=1 Tax=Australasian snapper-associated noda-like virus TaxID=2486229 RepID=A0A3G4R7N4_9VIRU|nr:RNA-dependent RNA-polymerase [Australasian snapper-associated noda-like virus]
MDSFQDPIRTLRKLHLSSAPQDVPVGTALANKASGYAVTDSRTPVISTWAAHTLSLFKVDENKKTREDKWRCKMPWPQQDAESIKIAFLHVSGLSESDVDRMEQRILATEDQEGYAIIGAIQLDDLPTPEIEVAMGHEVLGPGPRVTGHENQTEATHIGNLENDQVQSVQSAVQDETITRPTQSRQPRRRPNRANRKGTTTKDATQPPEPQPPRRPTGPNGPSRGGNRPTRGNASRRGNPGGRRPGNGCAQPTPPQGNAGCSTSQPVRPVAPKTPGHTRG